MLSERSREGVTDSGRIHPEAMLHYITINGDRLQHRRDVHHDVRLLRHGLSLSPCGPQIQPDSADIVTSRIAALAQICFFICHLSFPCS